MASQPEFFHRQPARLAAGLLLAGLISGCSSGGGGGGDTEPALVEREASEFAPSENPGVGQGFLAQEVLGLIADAGLFGGGAEEGIASIQSRQMLVDTYTLDYDGDGVDDLQVMVRAPEEPPEADANGGQSEGSVEIQVLEPLVIDDPSSDLTWTVASGSQIGIDLLLSVSNYTNAASRRGVFSVVSHYQGVAMSWTDGVVSGEVEFSDGQIEHRETATVEQLVQASEGRTRVQVSTGSAEQTYRFVWERSLQEFAVDESVGSQSFELALGDFSFEFGPYSITDVDPAPDVYIETEGFRYGPFTPAEIQAFATVEAAAN